MKSFCFLFRLFQPYLLLSPRKSKGLLAFCALFVIPAFLFSKPAQAEQVPLWLIDGSIAAITLPAYPGSSYNRNFVIPFPNFRLNSPYLQSSGGGVNARLFNSEKVDLGLTFGASIPTKTKYLKVRKDRNMPDLDPTIEVGLGLRYIPFKNDDWEFKTQFPLRKATGLEYKDQNKLWEINRPLDLGWTFSPRFTVTRFINNDGVRHEIDFEVGSKFATQQNMQFFYGVEQQYTLVGEQPYTAEEGLMNNWVELGWVRKHERWRFSMSVEYQDLHNANNLASPLLEEKQTWSGFMILTYTFAESDLLVDQDSEYRN